MNGLKCIYGTCNVEMVRGKELTTSELEEAKQARMNDQKYHETEINSWKNRYNQLEEEHQSRGSVSLSFK